MDPIEQTNIEPEVEIEMERRLQAHFIAEFGSPRNAGELWQTISAQLGEQDKTAPAQVAVGLNGTNIGDEKKVEELHELLRLAPAKPQTPPRRRWVIWNPAIAATLVLTLASVLVGLLATVNGAAGIKPGPNVLPNSGFEGGLGDWSLTNSLSNGNLKEYGASIDTSVVHSGKASAYISATVSNPAQFGALGTKVTTQGLQGKRLRFSAYVKTEGDKAWAELGMAITGKLPPELDGPQHAFNTTGEAQLDMDNMDDRPILGTTDWTRYDLVLDVPADATNIDLGFTFGGAGRGWLDDVQLSIVGDGVPTTSAFRNSQPVNMGFEDGFTGWLRGTTRPFDYATGTDTTIYYDGKASGFIRSLPNDGQGDEYLDLHQTLNTQNYKGKRVRFSAYLKTQDIHGEVQLWIGVTDISGMMVSMNWTRLAQGTTGWQKYEADADVPANYSHSIDLAVTLSGSGQVWIDDAQLEVVGNAAPLASPAAVPSIKP